MISNCFIISAHPKTNVLQSFLYSFDFAIVTIHNSDKYQEVRQYILEKKGVDIGNNFNTGILLVWILVGSIVVAGGIGIWNIYQKYQHKKEENNEIVSIDDKYQ